MIRLNPTLRSKCNERGLALTVQRQLIYDVVMASHEHPSPEVVCERVRKQLPNVSLATVYNTLRSFVSAGILQEISPHHGAIRVDGNLMPHHHLVCRICKRVEDIMQEDIEPVRLRRRPLAGFKIERYSVDFIGECAKCSARTKPSVKHQS